MLCNEYVYKTSQYFISSNAGIVSCTILTENKKRQYFGSFRTLPLPFQPGFWKNKDLKIAQYSSLYLFQCNHISSQRLLFFRPTSWRICRVQSEFSYLTIFVGFQRLARHFGKNCLTNLKIFWYRHRTIVARTATILVWRIEVYTVTFSVKGENVTQKSFIYRLLTRHGFLPVWLVAAWYSSGSGHGPTWN